MYLCISVLMIGDDCPPVKGLQLDLGFPVRSSLWLFLWLLKIFHNKFLEDIELSEEDERTWN